MQVVVNSELIKRKARVGKIAFVVGMLGLGVGFITSLQMTGPDKVTDLSAVAISYGALISALIALSIGRYHIARWSRRPRADQVLSEALNALDPRHYLFSYLPTVPVEHLLVTPRGLLVLVAKHVYGDIRNRGNRWQRKIGLSTILGGYSEGSLGNPSFDAVRAVAAVQSQLKGLGDAASQVPVSAAIVFTDRRAIVDVKDPAVPVVPQDDLLDFVRSLHADTKLSPERLEQLANLFAPDRKRYQQLQETSKGKNEAGRQRKRRKAPAPQQDMSKTGRNRAERRMR